MTQTQTPPRPLAPSPSLENCDALMISLASQRFVIVRRNQPIRIWSAEQICRPVRKLRPGEEVFYNGSRDKVRAMAVY